MSDILHDNSDMVDTNIKDILVEVPVETKDYYFKNEMELNETARDTDREESGASKASIELKSILCVAKEANLNTNIENKRKNLDSEGKVMKKSDQSGKVVINADAIKQPPVRPIIRVDYAKSDVDLNETIETTKDISQINLNLQDDCSDVIAQDIIGAKSRKDMSTNVVIIINNKRKDPFCWRCHHDKPTFYCETCPRSFHQKCLKHNVAQADHFICPLCILIMKAENLKQRSPPLRNMSMDHFCGLLKFALKRMTQVEGHEPFINPVNETDFPEYKKYVAQPMDLTCLDKNLKNGVYGSPQAFEADAQWILHNSIIFNSYQSKFTTIAKSMMKICKQEMSEIENCANCYLNANTKRKTWFVEVCPKPHMVVWAKLKGFPYWPAKAMRTNSFGMVDVRFFGAHDRAWVPCKDCFLYCLQDPNSNKQKRHDINESIKELNIYIENLKRLYGEFRCAPFKLVLDPEQELKQLKILLPRYSPDMKIKPNRGFRKSLHRNGNCTPDLESCEKDCDEDSVDGNEQHISSETNNSGSISDESSNFSNAPGRVSSIRMRGGFINTSGRIKVIPKTPTRKRVSPNEIDDCPPKLSRHTSYDSLNHSDSESSEACSNTIQTPDCDHHDEIDCPKLVDETKELTESQTQSTMTDILFKKLSDLIDEQPVKTNIVSDTDMLLNTISNTNEALLEKDIDLDIASKIKAFEIVSNIRDLDIASNIKDLDIASNLNDLDIASDTKDLDIASNTKVSGIASSTNNNISMQEVPKICSETIGTVEVIEVDVSESTEASEEVAFDEPQNIQNLVRASDISIVSITDPVIDTVKETIQEPAVRETSLPSITPLEYTTTSSLSVEEFANPLDFVEVAVTMPMDGDKNASEGELMIAENTDDVLNSLVNVPVVEAGNKTSLKPPINNKRKRSCDTDQTLIAVEESVQQKKALRLVNIDDIRNKVLDCINPPSNPVSEPITTLPPAQKGQESTVSSEPIRSLQLLLENHLSTSKNSGNVNVSETVVIKSEPNSEDEVNDAEYMELKLRYLSALNISEKLPLLPPKKPISMRTRSKSEENKMRPMDNLGKVIEEVATQSSTNKHGTEGVVVKDTLLKRKELFVKPLAKMQMPKQKARKSFPMPVRNVYPAPSQRKDIIRPIKPVPSSVLNPSALRTVPVVKPVEQFTTTNNIVYVAHSPSSTLNNSMAALPPNQPITYSCNRGNPILTMVQNSNNNYLPIAPPTCNKSANERFESQNYIPLCGEIPRPRCMNAKGIPATIAEIAISTTTSGPVVQTLSTVTNTSASTELLDGLGTLTSLIPDTLNKTISDIMCRAPPKLKPRPPGPLSMHFDEGLPSSVGTVTSRVNSISHRLGDYFRGMLVELLHEMSSGDNAEAEITKLKLENEELKYRHTEEILEIKKNISTVLKDVQKSIEDERTRIVEETRSACETECVKRVEEAKSKQWCANCPKEAQFYCCWNTSYCDFPCQAKHWSQHMPKCTQNVPMSRSLTSNTNTTSTTTPRSSQPIVLRQTAPPKGFTTKALLAKPTKVIVNRSNVTKNPLGYVRTTSGSHITLVESTPGNYELVGNGGPISVGGKFITTSGFGKMRSNSVISTAPPSNIASTSVGIGNNTPKTVIISQAKPIQPAVTTVISDDELE